MELDFPAFAFIMTLAAVINGLGIVRLLASFAEYLRFQSKAEVIHYWVCSLWIAFQFLMHILIWWSMWNARAAEAFTFLHYLYLLSGPILLFLATGLIIPEFDDRNFDVYQHYYAVRIPYFTVISIFWLWAIFLFPVLTGKFAPTVPVLSAFLALSVTLRVTVNSKIHAAAAVSIWVLFTFFVAVFAMRLGAVAEAVKNAA